VRSVTITRKAARSGGRTKTARTARAPRGSQDRAVFGRRTTLHNDPFSRFFRSVRRALSFRNPMFLLTASVIVATAVAALFIGGYVHRARAAVDAGIDAVVADAGFDISKVQLIGKHHVSPGDVYAALGFGVGQSIFGADVQAARANLRSLPWIADAEVTRRYPDAVEVRLTEKVPFAIWNDGNQVRVVDRAGEPITQADRAEFPRLPVFVGDKPDGASDLVEAIALHRAVAARVKAMKRVGGRRWNLVLDDGVIVKLPEDSWGAELGTLERMIVDRGVLEYDVSEIDLRTHGHFYFRLRHPPAPSHKKSRGDAA
jgi:cell division protein FtsQ